MFKNIHLKIFALVLATIFWIFVVSLGNTFFQFPGEVPIQVFNQASDLALASALGDVKLTLRGQDPVALRKLSPSDFEAYIDLRNSGAGTHRITISVTSKNPQVSVVRVEPAETEIILEPLRTKIFPIMARVLGMPAKGYKTGLVKLSQENVSVSGAERVLKKLATIKAMITLQGTEEGTTTKTVQLEIFDRNERPLEGLQIEKNDIEALIEVVQVAVVEDPALAGLKEVAITPKFVGALGNGVVKKVETTPSMVMITGPREVLDKLTIVETEAIDLKDITVDFEKTVKIILPAGVSLAIGQALEVKVTVVLQQ